MFILLGILAFIAYSVYLFFTWDFDYWTERGVSGPKPWPILGNLKNDFLHQRNVAYDVQDIYREYKSQTPFVGIFQIREPNLLILDPMLIKDIMVRNFKNFQNNGMSMIVDKRTDPLLARDPFVLENAEWRAKRSEVTPAFTTNKMKALFPLIDDVARRMTTYIHSQLSKTTEPFDTRMLCSKYTLDTVCSCIFAVDAESFTKENSEFRENGMKILNFSLPAIITIMISATFPVLKKVITLPIISKDVESFFLNLMDQSLKHREESKIDRDDYLAYLIALKKKKQIESMDMAAHAVSFFTDGFITSSVAITNVLYELGKNRNIQEKLRQEIVNSISEHGSVTFESLNSMEYLDQVFNESLRLHPPVTFTSRVCNKSIEIEGAQGKKLLVEENLSIYIPILQVHLDPENYEDPDTFYPERFDNGAIKAYKDKCLFIPFGQGPRVCLGFKFVTIQAKVAIVEILRNFEIIANKKTREPLIIEPTEILNAKIGGIWIDFRPIDKI